jgi:hypothetical protein
VANNFRINCLAGLHKSMRDVIGIDDSHAKRSEHLAYDRLSRGDATG